jgi:hypothetical protein
MKRNLSLAALLALLAAGACKSPSPSEAPPAPPEQATTEIPLEETYAGEVQHAKHIFGLVAAALMTRLSDALEEIGAPAAIAVCKVEAPMWTSRATDGTGIEAGRTSHALRNPANAPRPWMEPIVKEGAGKKVSEVGMRVVDLGEKVGVARPIGTMGLCVTCHGDDKAVSAEVVTAIAQKYPDDKARGFAEGDVRGWFWAEVPKVR